MCSVPYRIQVSMINYALTQISGSDMNRKKKIVLITAIGLAVLIAAGTVIAIMVSVSHSHRQIDDQINQQLESIIVPGDGALDGNAVTAKLRQRTTYQIRDMKYDKKTFQLYVSAPDLSSVVESLIDPEREVTDIDAESQNIETALMETLTGGATPQFEEVIDCGYSIQDDGVVLDFDQLKLANVLSGGMLGKYAELLEKYENGE